MFTISDVCYVYFLLRYEVNFQTGIDCGGAYVKLLSQTPDLNLVRIVLKVKTNAQKATVIWTVA